MKFLIALLVTVALALGIDQCAQAQFVPGQILTASQLNAALTTKANTASPTFTGSVTAPLFIGNVQGNATTATTATTALNVSLDAICTTQGSVVYRDASVWTCLSPGTSGYVLKTQGAGANPAWVAAATSGTVTSVSLTMPGIFSVSGSPVTTSGTLAVAASGTSGGVPYFSGGTTLASSAALTAGLPVVGGGTGAAPTVGTRSGNTTSFATTSGALTSTHCAKFDASGNVVDAGAACGTSSPGGADTQIQYNTAGAFDSSAAFTYNNATTTLTLGGNATIANNGTGATDYLGTTLFDFDTLSGGTSYYARRLIASTTAATHTGTLQGTVAIQSRPLGSGNSSDSGDHALLVSNLKQNYLTTGNAGGIGGIFLVTKNGGGTTSDSGGYQADMTTVGNSGFGAVVEAYSRNVNASNVEQSNVHLQAGVNNARDDNYIGYLADMNGKDASASALAGAFIGRHSGTGVWKLFLDFQDATTASLMKVDKFGRIFSYAATAGGQLQIAPTGAHDATILLNAPTGQAGAVNFLSNSTVKYGLGKQTDNTFYIYDAANARTFFTYNPTANATTFSGYLVMSDGSTVTPTAGSDLTIQAASATAGNDAGAQLVNVGGSGHGSGGGGQWAAVGGDSGTGAPGAHIYANGGDTNPGNVELWTDGGTILADTAGSGGSYIEMIEQTAPPAPAANRARLYLQDNGAGKTQLMILFSSGAAQQIAIQP